MICLRNIVSANKKRMGLQAKSHKAPSERYLVQDIKDVQIVNFSALHVPTCVSFCVAAQWYLVDTNDRTCNRRQLSIHLCDAQSHKDCKHRGCGALSRQMQVR